MKKATSNVFQFAKGPMIDVQQLLALRHPAKTLPLFQNKKSIASMGGGHRSSFRGRGMDFEEVRIYQAGDDVRNIDWRVTARTSQTHTKVFREEKERPIILVLDQRNSMRFGTQVTYKSVMAAQLATLIGWAGLQNNDKVGGIVFNDFGDREVKPKGSNHALLSLIHHTSEFNQALLDENSAANKPAAGSSTPIHLHHILEKTYRLAKPGSAVFIISDFMDYDAQAEKLLQMIKRHTDVYALCIADLMERNLPIHSQLNVTDGVSKQLVNTQKKSTLEKYQKTFDEKHQALAENFKKSAVSSQLIWTHENPLNALQKIMRSSPRARQNGWLQGHG